MERELGPENQLWREAEFRESAAGDEPHCLLCLVCVPNRADGWSHSRSYKQLRPPSFPLALLFSARLFLGS